MQPLVFHPLLKQIRWGGRRLGEVLGKPIGAASDYAESWEIADHGSDQSIVAGGKYAGWTLARLVAERNAELFGRHAGATQFPLLVKFLDAGDHLSVQVHPDDARAKLYDPHENGKTEAWIIVDAVPGAKLYAGLKPEVTARQLRAASANGTVEKLLHSFEVSPGECLFIPAGTVHAIGAGVLVAEIQQSSDLTFRLFDWNRVGTDGKPRQLHLDEAIACTDFERGPVDPVRPVRREHSAGVTDDLVHGEYFVIRRHILEREYDFPAGDCFRVLMMLRGTATLHHANDRIELSPGRTVLIPAASGRFAVEPRFATASTPDAVLIEAFLP